MIDINPEALTEFEIEFLLNALDWDLEVSVYLSLERGMQNLSDPDSKLYKILNTYTQYGIKCLYTDFKSPDLQALLNSRDVIVYHYKA
ncbi:MAG: hypothetical protein ACKOAD_07905 [Gammaproteobacteria bacterium]